MRATFVDTVGLLALWDEDDQWREAASKAWQACLANNAIPYSSPFVFLECGNAAARRPYRPFVDALRQQFERARTLVWPTDEEWQQAWQAYTREGPGGAGIVDQVSFITMRRMGITDAFTNDRHFAAAGFVTLF